MTWVDDEEDEGWGLTQSKLSVKLQEEEAASRNAKKKVEGSTEVRIRIGKKQLEQLLRQADTQGLPLRRVLAGLIGETGRLEELEKHWRPKLRTIPEVAVLAY